MNEKDVLIIHPYLKNERVFKDSNLIEAVSLSKAIKLKPLISKAVGLEKINSKTYLNSGIVNQTKESVLDNNIDLVFLNCNLTPIQQRNLENDINSKIIDRTGLILEIFGARAISDEGKLQVNLASLVYQKSRLVRSWTHLERQRGGAGFMGGPGERQIESDRRQLTEKINRIKKKIKVISNRRDLQRYRRKKNRLPVVTLVGYTNSGKSTLFNNITKSEILAKDMLFATLDSTIRKFDIYNNKFVLIDTVGFIKDLPTNLIAAFKSTLDEITSSDIILHIRDISNSDSLKQRNDVLTILGSIGINSDDERIIEVMNKIDLNSNFLNNKKRDISNYIYISAHKKIGLGQLKENIYKKYQTLSQL